MLVLMRTAAAKSAGCATAQAMATIAPSEFVNTQYGGDKFRAREFVYTSAFQAAYLTRAGSLATTFM